MVFVALSLYVEAWAQDHVLFTLPEIDEAADHASNDRDVMRQRGVKLGLELAKGKRLEPLPRFTLNLFEDHTYTAALDELVKHGNRRYAWIGHLQEDSDSSVVLMVRHGVVAGTVRIGQEYFRIRFAGDGLHVVQEVDRFAAPPEEPPFPVEVGPNVQGDMIFEDDGSTFDVMFVYTPAARSAAGGTSSIESLIELGVTETNLAYQNSAVIPRVRAVHIQEVVYTESGSISTDLSRLRRTSDGYLDEVHGLRNQYGADLVQLVVEGGCGVAYLMSGNNPGFASYAFSVASRICISPNYTLGHELGHNMGCNHAPEDPIGTGAFDWSFGYKDQTAGFRTVMAYSPGKRVLHFSNPAKTYNGAVTGVWELQDNADSLNGVRVTIANFRQAVGTPPPAEPDLMVESVSLVSPNPVEGDDVYFSAVVKNVGNAATPSGQSVTVSFDVDGGMVDTEAFSNLSSGASVTVQTSSAWPAAAGDKMLSVLADDPDQVTEPDEANNSSSMSFTVAAAPPAPEPDLVIDSLGLSPTSPADGDSVQFSATVRNIGDASTGGSFTVSFRVNGTVVHSEVVSTLAAGASVPLQSSAWQATAGDNQVLTVKADDANQVTESNEGNNESAMNFNVAEPPPPDEPDLVIDSVGLLPASPTEGDLVHFSATVRNAGTAATPSGQSVSISFSVNGTLFTTLSTSQLTAGASATLSTAGGQGWQATAGSKTLSATADPSNLITEVSETNNTRSKSFTVTTPPGEPEITSPTSGSMLSTKRQTFRWSANGSNVSAWRLVIVDAASGQTVYASRTLRKKKTSTSVRRLPSNSTLNVVLQYQIGGAWQSTGAYVYNTAAADQSGKKP